LPVPTPVAAVYERRGLVYRSDLITGLLPSMESFGSKLKGNAMTPELWKSIGACVRSFHAHGIYHADLNVHNILIGPEGQVYLIDFDRGGVRAPGSWVESNWSRLHRSIVKVCRSLPPDRFNEDAWSTLRYG
jgi:3-deoxy-D-manno-octulosonic acid kinase